MERVKKIYESVDAIVWFILVFVIVALIFVPNFATESNITNIFSQACVLLTVACGVHFSVLNGGVDFSSTSIIALTCVVGASIMSTTSGLLAGKWYAIPVALLAMLLICLLYTSSTYRHGVLRCRSSWCCDRIPGLRIPWFLRRC